MRIPKWCTYRERERERGHMYQMKSLFQPLKLRFHWQWETLFTTRFLLGSYLVPPRFLAPMAASKMGPPVAFAIVLWTLFWSDQNFWPVWITNNRSGSGSESEIGSGGLPLSNFSPSSHHNSFSLICGSTPPPFARALHHLGLEKDEHICTVFEIKYYRYLSNIYT